MVRLWDVAAHRCLRRLEGEHALVHVTHLYMKTIYSAYGLACTTDARWFMTCCNSSPWSQQHDGMQQSACAYSHVKSGQCALPRNITFRLGAAGHTAAVKGVAIAPSGDLAVSCSTDATVRLWRLPYAPFHAGDVEQADQAVLHFQGAHGFRQG